MSDTYQPMIIIKGSPRMVTYIMMAIYYIEYRTYVQHMKMLPRYGSPFFNSGIK